ncbi:MAG: hypothetical protein JW891_04890 [Candidatus Lokiarchaeota archaeon]|nr:hypothetical protein [Candidatus Lokiarchaeota archaeon]
MKLIKKYTTRRVLKKAARNIEKIASKTMSFNSEEDIKKACDNERIFWFERRFENSFLVDCLSFIGTLFIVIFFFNLPILPYVDESVKIVLALVIFFGIGYLIFAISLLFIKRNEFLVLTPDSIFWRRDLSLRVLTLRDVSKVELKWTENKKDHVILLWEKDNFISWIKLGRLTSRDKFYGKIPEIIYDIVNIYWESIERD